MNSELNSKWKIIVEYLALVKNYQAIVMVEWGSRSNGQGYGARFYQLFQPKKKRKPLCWFEININLILRTQTQFINLHPWMFSNYLKFEAMDSGRIGAGRPWKVKLFPCNETTFFSSFPALMTDDWWPWKLFIGNKNSLGSLQIILLQ